MATAPHAGARRTIKIVHGGTTLNIQPRAFNFETINARVLDARANGDNANSPFMKAGIKDSGSFDVLDQFAELRALHGLTVTLTEIINTAGIPSNGTVWTGYLRVPAGVKAPHDGLQTMTVRFFPTAIPTAFAAYKLG